MQTYHKLIKTAGEWTLSPGTESIHRVLILPPTPGPKAVAAAAGIDIDHTAETIMGLAKSTWSLPAQKWLYRMTSA